MYLAQFAYLSIWVGIWLVVSTFWLLWKMEVTLLYSCLPEWLFSGCIDGFLVTLLICWGGMSLSSIQWYHVSGRSVSSHHWWLLWARLWPLVFSKRDEWLGWCLALNPLTEKLPSSPFFHGNARLFLGGRPVMTFIRRFSGGRVWPIQGLCLETSYIFFFRLTSSDKCWALSLILTSICQIWIRSIIFNASVSFGECRLWEVRTQKRGLH